MLGLGESVTVRRSAAPGRPGRARDGFGERLPTTTHVVAGCAFAPGGASESNERGETVTADGTLYGPYDADIRASDEVEIGGRWFQVVGDPSPWRDPFTGENVGSSTNLRAVRG